MFTPLWDAADQDGAQACSSTYFLWDARFFQPVFKGMLSGGMSGSLCEPEGRHAAESAPGSVYHRGELKKPLIFHCWILTLNGNCSCWSLWLIWGLGCPTWPGWGAGLCWRPKSQCWYQGGCLVVHESRAMLTLPVLPQPQRDHVFPIYFFLLFMLTQFPCHC